MKFLVIDDHQIFREGLIMLLEQKDEQAIILGAGSCEEGLNLINLNPDIDLLILDINLPVVNGFEAMKIFSARYKELPIVVLTASESLNDMSRCFEEGAKAYVPKSSAGEVLINVIRLVLAGGTYAPPALTIGVKLGSSRQDEPSQQGPMNRLTARQKEVLTLLRDGMSNKAIATQLGVSESTVKVHVSGILKTLGMRSRLEVALRAEKLDKNSGGQGF